MEIKSPTLFDIIAILETGCQGEDIKNLFSCHLLVPYLHIIITSCKFILCIWICIYLYISTYTYR